MLGPPQSADLRDRLLVQLSSLAGSHDLLAWAKPAFPSKTPCWKQAPERSRGGYQARVEQAARPDLEAAEERPATPMLRRIVRIPSSSGRRLRCDEWSSELAKGAADGSANPSGDTGVGRVIACLVLYAFGMAGVRFYAQRIGVVGALLSIAGLYGVARWYERR
jgi:hypothetical protein